MFDWKQFIARVFSRRGLAPAPPAPILQSPVIPKSADDLGPWLFKLNMCFLGMAVTFTLTLWLVCLVHHPPHHPDPIACRDAEFAMIHSTADNNRFHADADKADELAKAETDRAKRDALRKQADAARADAQHSGRQMAQCQIQLNALMVNPANRRWNLFLIALGAVAAGLLIGFLYAVFGDETNTFSAFTTAINGFFAGAALTDLARTNGVLRTFFASLAESCGMPHAGALVAVVALPFATLGFFFLYVNKRLILNLLTELANKGIENARQVLAEEAMIASNEPTTSPRVSDDVKQAAKTIVNAPNAGMTNDPDALKADAQAFYIEGRFRDAELALRKADQLRPDDPETLVLLANARIVLGRYADAIIPLERVVRKPEAPAIAWKLLGYAGLWEPSKRDAAAKASETYLAMHPGDVGAMINLACALAAPGPSVARRMDVLHLAASIGASPDGKERLRQLTAVGEEFEGWKDDPEFKKLID